MKLSILLFFALFSHLNIYAQIGFQDHLITDHSTAAEDASSVYSSDLDGDGDLDVLSASRTDDKIAWYENTDGLGTFGPQQIITLDADGANNVYASDLDGDGDFDVLSTSFEDGKIAWYENTDGLGNFGNQQIVSTDILGIMSIFTTDVDGDGDIDVLSASIEDNKIAWYENTDGLGTFAAQQIISTDLDRASDVHAGDLDGDGDLDVLSASQGDHKIAWYKNSDGLGNFDTQQIITTTDYDVNNIFLSDLDGDGDLDIISSSFGYNKIYWYENIDGLGTFGSQQLITYVVHNPRAIYCTDLDGDGDMDVLSASREDNKIAWYENTDGLGTFGPQQIISTDMAWGQSVYAADIDGDGDMDVLSASKFDDRIAWYKNTDGQGTFGTYQVITESVAAGATAVYSADIDGDGDMDVLSASFTNDRIAWYENMDNQGTFGNQKIITDNAEGAEEVYAFDLDNDGDLDVLSASFRDDKIAWYENIDGHGNFSDQQIISSFADEAKDVYAVDLDGDGDLDVLSASKKDDKIAWYENTDGHGNFGDQQIITTLANGANSIHANDIDGDGDLDVFSASEFDNKIAWYENTNGLGTFGPQQIISTEAIEPTDIYTCDLDGDGDIDVLSTSKGDNKIAWYENTNGLGSFGPQIPITAHEFQSYDPASVYASDLDSDGDLDVLVASSGDDEIVWHENTDGQGVFGPQQFVAPIYYANFASSVYAADIDGDGNMDVLSASSIDDKIAWYENLNLTSNQIKGFIRLDTNDDGCDDLDLPLPSLMVIADNGTESLATFSLSNGFFQLFPDEGNYTTIITSAIPNYFTVNPTVHNSNFIGLGNSDISNFCLEANSGNELIISLLPVSQARPGFETSYQLVYQNFGTTQLSGNVILEFNPDKINFSVASEVVSSQSINTLTFDYNDLDPFETRTIDLSFNVLAPPIVNVGEELNFTATVNPIANDNTPADNVFTLNQTIVGAIDPNDITVLEGDKIYVEDTDDYLHYVIRFQNTGTADAINVKVTNVLDSNLDWSTLQPESISHANRIEIKDGNEVSFIFKNIHLPDSTNNEPASHGFIAYKIKPKSDIALGDIISNKADIFFDFNLAVETNTVTTEVVEYVDTEAPTVLCQNTIAALDDDGNATIEAVALDAGSSDNTGIISYAINANQFDCSDIGNVNLTLTVMDAAGNSNSCVGVVEVMDNISPIADIEILADVTGECEVSSLPIQTATDNCAGQILGTHNAILPITNPGSTEVIWTYDDGHGNISAQTQDVVIVHSSSPIADIEVLADVTGECEISSLPIQTATDNCVGQIMGTHDATLPITSQGTTIVTWTYDDGQGNISTQTQHVVIVDSTSPIADIEILADVTGECEVSILPIQTATDNCVGQILGTHNAILPITNQGSTEVIWTYDDGHGNISTQTQHVVIVDSSSPVADIEILADVIGECEVSSLPIQTATDNCAGQILGTHNAILPITNQGNTEVIWTYDDGYGNISTQTQQIILEDVINPIAVSQDITVDLNGAASISILPDQIDSGSTDNCGIDNLSLDLNTFTSVGDYTVVLSVEDMNNNISNASAIVTVTDATLSLEDEVFNKKLIVFPNPANDLIVIKADMETIRTVVLYTVLGEKIKEASTKTIDISELLAGTYIVKVRTESEKTGIKKIVKWNR